ncbi:MAG: hypothetical protein WA143_01435 [Lutibacter sp.]
MKIYFITYGSGKFKYSTKRLSKEAESLGFFSKIIVFTENDLPLCIKSSPLFYNNKGGGFWLWKPYIIDKILNEIDEGDVVVYSDAGNELLNSDKWNEYFNLLKNYNTIFFQYRENFDYGWNKFNPEYNDSPKLKFWTKKSTVDHFRNLFYSDKDWLEKNKILAGLIFIKKSKKSHHFFKEWLNNMLFFPHIVFDLFENEKGNQIEGFAQHRHDQSILSILVRHYEKSKNLLILNEEFETANNGQIVRTSRKIDPRKSHFEIFRKIKNRFKFIFKNKVLKIFK